MLVGGPKYLEEQVLRDNMAQQLQTLPIALPKKCHPILVDRFVTFLYTKEYENPPANGLLYPNSGTCSFIIVFLVPEYSKPTPEIAALVDALRHVFHLHMFALDERLQYEAPTTAAKDKIWDIIYGLMRSSIAMGVR
ncbi:uncharacterized protein M421DRAFT_121610 [Didymella exigua CBS 183.55]|uniref:Uncharacterized protein n=1 Tax=Didymella exigua CBS 183.55 TaxID=1150837 RepID=A0A6A5RT44_9PLEO|nr:uncharacterized protein M421DRAFT_121610 [Didymella exigua CBS 183.55]KAF1929506.1 hypothetical protein M421DRAFT_121610 [Didymella exigua CBS 183.55]